MKTLLSIMILAFLTTFAVPTTSAQSWGWWGHHHKHSWKHKRHHRKYYRRKYDKTMDMDSKYCEPTADYFDPIPDEKPLPEVEVE